MKTLFLGCHCDDIELGCGGTVNQTDDLMCVTLSCISPQGIDLRGRQISALNHLGVKEDEIRFYEMTTREFAKERQSIWEILKELEEEFRPDVVFTHQDDGHQDHRVLHEESLRKTFTGTIFSYSPTVLNSCNNYFVEITESTLEKKLAALQEYDCYQDKPYFNTKFVTGTAIVAGNAIEKLYAESFKTERLIKCTKVL